MGGGLLVLQLRLREGDERREEGAAAGPGQSLHLLQHGHQGENYLAHIPIVAVFSDHCYCDKKRTNPPHLSARKETETLEDPSQQ